MESFRKELCVRGYHIYQERWEVAIGEDLACQREHANLGTNGETVLLVRSMHRTFSHDFLHLLVCFRDR
jgi:hypothetical protein